jgi:hypothetical protein
MSEGEKLALCVGCRNNFYNGHNTLGVKRCWSLKSAEVVKRFRLGWWTRPDSPGAFTEVQTLSCHVAPGQYAHYEELPNFVNPSEVNRAA